MCACDPSRDKRQRKEEPGLLAKQSTQIDELQVQEESLSRPTPDRMESG